MHGQTLTPWPIFDAGAGAPPLMVMTVLVRRSRQPRLEQDSVRREVIDPDGRQTATCRY
jgi:hypothetical protein